MRSKGCRPLNISPSKKSGFAKSLCRGEEGCANSSGMGNGLVPYEKFAFPCRRNPYSSSAKKRLQATLQCIQICPKMCRSAKLIQMVCCQPNTTMEKFCMLEISGLISKTHLGGELLFSLGFQFSKRPIFHRFAR